VRVTGSGKHSSGVCCWRGASRLIRATRNYYWRQNPNATAYIQASEGLFIGEIVQRLEQVINHNMTQRYVHVFAHDGDVGPLAGALGINLLRWPAMASNVAFEIWYFKLPSH